MKPNYRNEARSRLAAAKNELASGDDTRLRYAALELRMTMEALTYDRALAFKDEFPPSEYETWQPRKVMSVLLEIDPSADADIRLAIGVEEEYGMRSSDMQLLGEERVLNMAVLRKHYDALGSYLHLPSMKQALDGKIVDFVGMRSRCDTLVALIDATLASPIFNVTPIREFARLECSRCGRLMRKRLPRDFEEMTAECFECRATYSLTPAPDGEVLWSPKGAEAHCAVPGCAGTMHLWESDLKPGLWWSCELCGGRNALKLGVYHEPDSDKAAKEER